MTMPSFIVPGGDSSLRLAIDRLTCKANVPVGTRSPAQLGSRLSRVARRYVAQACRDALPSLEGEDSTVYRIKHLRLELWVDAQGMSDAEIGRRWGEALAAAVVRSVRRGGSLQVVSFPSPRHFLAAFLRDLVDGWAWRRWYYDEFRILERLPPPAVAVELLAPRPDWIETTFLELSGTGHAVRLIGRMTTSHISRLWAALGLPPQPLLAGPPPPDLAAPLLGRWPQVALSGGIDAASRARDRLSLLLAAAQSQPGLARNPQAASLAHALVDILALVRLNPDLGMALMMQSGLYPAARQRIAAGPLADILAWLTLLSNTGPGRAHLAWLAETASDLAGLSASFLDAPAPPSLGDTAPSRPPPPQVSTAKGMEGDVLTDHTDIPSHADAGAEQESARTTPPAPPDAKGPPLSRRPRQKLAPITSPAGSVFLTALAMAETGLWDLWKSQEGEAQARCYLFIIALKAVGRSQAPLYLGDAMLAAFAGLEQPPVADARLPVMDDNPPASWANVLPEIAARWYPPHLRDAALGRARGLDVLRDAVASLWLAARPSPPDPPDYGTAAGFQPDPVSPAAPWPGPAVDLTTVRPVMSEQEQAALESEAAHLQLGQRMGYPWLTPSLDASLSVAASLVFRRTASLLPRFAASGPVYVARNFLVQQATLYPGPHALTVQLSGGPLAVVLRMASLPETSSIPWLPVPLRLALPSGISGTT